MWLSIPPSLVSLMATQKSCRGLGSEAKANEAARARNTKATRKWTPLIVIRLCLAYFFKVYESWGVWTPVWETRVFIDGDRWPSLCFMGSQWRPAKSAMIIFIPFFFLFFFYFIPDEEPFLSNYTLFYISMLTTTQFLAFGMELVVFPLLTIYLPCF